MMENLQVNQREKKTRHSSRQCRRKGLVPGVIYGKGINNFLFEIGELELNHALSVTGEHGLLSINSQEGSLNTLIKEVQRDPVTRRVLHIDLEKVEGNEEIETAVPINYVGEEYINKLDAVLQKNLDSIKVKCSPSNIPKGVNLNVGRAKPGDQFKIADVEFGNEITVVDDLNSIVASVSYDQKIITQEVVDQEVAENRAKKES
ncbi:50S ribosomal protein L25 [Clostridium perfringens]|uniref:Large ribosomal subunit protein bL25 n=9 Tax=Clostridium TaxID=1485 RepID=RL25_CLOPE|nr:50S ribosomal protein L25 [Clostridium perfringens]Q8XJ87.1 RecName: Full=Large ribosomal subunit protein bL25; AltName: Full=50S ribosomal protein L25; AltName: Full=General stress protein CTC [Clostridium perfringens str. 13]EDT15146.1 ribosomal 5S rRNA E-loop binding protein Ctc/L25/TL5 [Clostridium perfringens E str. JGS1987]EDT25828.1 ribosomal 5S rRNA E-loop binding protein Ctc/L25/TL5 [Clostridium perfringens CPE str. F4969]EDT71086.1 ribosomal 5S rRNA E-loop binding protein Ctc/L25/T